MREWTDLYTDYLFWSNQKQIIPVRFDLSRFIVDVERLENDPLDAIGQGILYKKFVDCERTSDSSEQRRLLSAYYQHIDKLRNNLTSQSILIDCHSFPSVLSDIDICIGFNKDWSQPTNDVIDLFIEPFDKILLIKNLQMRNIIINFVASKYEKNGKYGDYKERRPKNHSAT